MIFYVLNKLGIVRLPAHVLSVDLEASKLDGTLRKCVEAIAHGRRFVIENVHLGQPVNDLNCIFEIIILIAHF